MYDHTYSNDDIKRTRSIEMFFFSQNKNNDNYENRTNSFLILLYGNELNFSK